MHAHYAHTHASIHVYTHAHMHTHIHEHTHTRTRQRHAGGISNAVVKWAIDGEKGGRKERTSPQLWRGGTALSLTSDGSQFILIGQVKAKAREGNETWTSRRAWQKCVGCSPHGFPLWSVGILSFSSLNCRLGYFSTWFYRYGSYFLLRPILLCIFIFFSFCTSNASTNKIQSHSFLSSIILLNRRLPASSLHHKGCLHSDSMLNVVCVAWFS